MTDAIQYPFDSKVLMRKKRSIRRELLSGRDLMDKRIAILGGSTTSEIRDMLELFLLQGGIRPLFYESEYNRYFEDVMFQNDSLRDFAPEVIYLHTSNVNIIRYPSARQKPPEIESLLESEVDRFVALWDKIASDFSCPVIQNNFELPHYRGLGNLDAYDVHGRSRFIGELNRRFSEQAGTRPHLHINDIHYLSAWFGLERWYDRRLWYSYKYAMSYDAIPLVADSVASIVKAVYGKTKKCLVLDLDNTLWGGVIGDDGVNGIQIGKETPEAEAYTEFQHFIRHLKERGVLLAVCSKNDDANAREGFSHPDSILSIDDFSVFSANWKPKPENIRAVAQSLNIGIDSLVFADDNPVERDIVRSQEPEVAVPEMGSNVLDYITILDKNGYFETISLSAEDTLRNSYYADNTARHAAQTRYASYGDFLQSLEMVAEIKPFVPLYLDRITQLTNKTNQFNLTTRRYSSAEMAAVTSSANYITLYGRLQDKYGDNGLVSVIVGEIKGKDLHLDLWLMSCRVLKRDMEKAMLDQLVASAQARGITAILGYYYATSKNGMVSGLFEELGFRTIEKKENNDSIWRLDISSDYCNENRFITVR